jgi:hypothetical protein
VAVDKNAKGPGQFPAGANTLYVFSLGGDM